MTRLERLERAIYNRMLDIFNRRSESMSLDEFEAAFDESVEEHQSKEVSEDEFFGRA